MKGLHMITWILLVIGGINWLLEGIINQGIGEWIGPGIVTKIIYILVGLSAVYEIITHKKNCKLCGGQGMAPMA